MFVAPAALASLAALSTAGFTVEQWADHCKVQVECRDKEIEGLKAMNLDLQLRLDEVTARFEQNEELDAPTGGWSSDHVIEHLKVQLDFSKKKVEELTKKLDEAGGSKSSSSKTWLDPEAK